MKRTHLASLAVLAGAMLAAPAFADQALATSKNCMACHAVDK
ncbi:MAG: cytochrome C', partial [Rhodoferax sp.]